MVVDVNADLAQPGVSVAIGDIGSYFTSGPATTTAVFIDDLHNEMVALSGQQTQQRKVSLDDSLDKLQFFLGNGF